MPFILQRQVFLSHFSKLTGILQAPIRYPLFQNFRKLVAF